MVIEATGSPAALTEEIAMARDAGTYVIAGQYTDNGDIVINPHREINKKHLTIKGTWGIDFRHFYRSIQVMAKFHDRFSWEKLISRYYRLDLINTALNDVESQRVIKAVIAPQLAGR